MIAPTAKKLIYRYPNWLLPYTNLTNLQSLDPEYLMSIANELALRNIQHNSGGPFGAVTVNTVTKKIIGFGINASTNGGSIFHAEVLAIWDGLRSLSVSSYSDQKDPITLVTSSSPCAMCLGAIFWSGLKTLITGAPTSEVTKLGFDEGYLPKNIKLQCKKRGITLIPNILVEQCVDVLSQYNGKIYNGV